MQTDATTPNTLKPTIVGVNTSVLAIVCKRMQQLSNNVGTCSGIAGRIQPIRIRKPCVMCVRGPNNVGRAVRMDATLLHYTSVITEQKKCWELLAQTFDRFQTLLNNTQQNATTCYRVCKRTQHLTFNNVGSCWPTMLHLFERGFSNYLKTAQ